MGDIDLSGVFFFAIVGMVMAAVLAVVAPGAIIGFLWWAMQPRFGLPWDGMSVGFSVSASILAVSLVGSGFLFLKR